MLEESRSSTRGRRRPSSVAAGSLHRARADRGPTSRGSRRSTPRSARSSRPTPTRSRSPTRSTPSDARARPRAAPRHPGPPQGQRRHRRPDDDHGRLARARGLDAAARRARRRAAARGRRGDPRQGQPLRVGELPLDALVSGWSARGGQCRNPYALDRNPCGSSSGSGVAVSANLVRARGRHRDRRLDRLPVHEQRRRRDQADGRPREPRRASSPSRTPRTPPARWRARWPTRPRCSRRSPASTRATRRPRRRRPRGRLHAFLDADGLRGARIGVARNLAGFHPDTDRLFDEALAEMKRARGRDRGPGRRPARPRSSSDPEFEVLLYEFKADLEAYLASLGPKARVRTLADADRLQRREHREREMPFFGQELFLKAQEKGPLIDARLPGGAREVPAPLARRGARRACSTSTGSTRSSRRPARPAWVDRPVNGDHFVGGNSTPAAVAGLPERHRADGLRLRPAGRALVHRPRLERADADPARLRVRAGDAPPASANGGACSRRWRTRT